jgi:outer membrane protein
VNLHLSCLASLFLSLLFPIDAPEAVPTVEEAVRVALQNSPKLRAARFEALANQAQTDRERPVARPTVTAQAEGRVQGPRVTFPRDGTGDATVLPERYGRVELTVDQVLYHAGASAARIRYQSQTRANAWEIRRAENDLILSVRRAWFQRLAAQAGRETAREGVTLAQKHLDLTRTMLQAGTASERDVKASDADLAEAEQGLTKAENGVALAEADLNRVMGRDSSAPLALPAPLPLPPVPDSPEAGIEQALKQRPEIWQLEEGIRAARAGVTLAGTQDSPTLSGRATALTQTPSAFNNSRYLAAGLVVTWNPFDRDKTRLDVKEAQARAGQLGAQLEELRLGIRLEVEKAWRDMKEAKARIETATRQVDSAVSALNVSELRYEVRMATQLEVSSALFNVTKALANRGQAITDLHLASADYAHATGADVTVPETGAKGTKKP